MKDELLDLGPSLVIVISESCQDGMGGKYVIHA